ncbi:RNA 2',3'-cyclic phosphodiesterase [Patescibacteria group bacterium]|nr:MAG: RNA 2',3'-cyclic phosphodiesterase [Patescibacteria group bacterium]
MQRKIFIGIDLPFQAKKRLAQKLEKFADLPVKWIDPELFHVTLLFLGHIENEDVPDLCERVREAVADQPMFEISLNHIELGPDPNNPKLVWASGESNEELRELFARVDKAASSASVEKKTFRPHVTLGRLRHYAWMTLGEAPVIDVEMNLAVPVDAVHIFESSVEQGRTRYFSLEICPLQ